MELFKNTKGSTLRGRFSNIQYWGVQELHCNNAEDLQFRYHQCIKQFGCAWTDSMTRILLVVKLSLTHCVFVNSMLCQSIALQIIYTN